MSKKIKIALIGATGNVGRKVGQMILERGLTDCSHLFLFASDKSIGKVLSINNHDFIVNSLENITFKDFDICIFNTESDVSENFIPKALSDGCYVVDSSSKYRLAKDVPLIIPPVNKHLINPSSKLYSHANCLASPIATVVSPLHKRYPILRINAVTYQSTSGAGKSASDECWNETAAIVNGSSYNRHHFKRQIAFNVIPQVGDIMDDGVTFEEYKIVQEVKKVVDQQIAINATAVRVPVMIGHSIALNLEFMVPFELIDIERILKESPSISFKGNDYATPIEVVNFDDVFVGRVRRDSSQKNSLNLWLCSDNLRRGAAADSVEIVQELIMQIKVSR